MVQLKDVLAKLEGALADAVKRKAPANIQEPLGSAKTFLSAVIAAGALARDQFGPMAFEQALENARTSLGGYQGWAA